MLEAPQLSAALGTQGCVLEKELWKMLWSDPALNPPLRLSCTFHLPAKFLSLPTGVGMPSITDFSLDCKGMLNNIISQEYGLCFSQL